LGPGERTPRGEDKKETKGIVHDRTYVPVGEGKGNLNKCGSRKGEKLKKRHKAGGLAEALTKIVAGGGGLLQRVKGRRTPQQRGDKCLRALRVAVY